MQNTNCRPEKIVGARWRAWCSHCCLFVQASRSVDTQLHTWHGYEPVSIHPLSPAGVCIYHWRSPLPKGTYPQNDNVQSYNGRISSHNGNDRSLGPLKSTIVVLIHNSYTGNGSSEVWMVLDACAICMNGTHIEWFRPAQNMLIYIFAAHMRGCAYRRAYFLCDATLVKYSNCELKTEIYRHPSYILVTWLVR